MTSEQEVKKAPKKKAQIVDLKQNEKQDKKRTQKEKSKKKHKWLIPFKNNLIMEKRIFSDLIKKVNQ